MKYTKIKKLPAEKFRRETGVKKTFNLMIEVIKIAEKEIKKKGGRKNKLPVEERLLMTLEYLREYRTYFHIANSYGVGESTCHENITKIENILIKSKKFSLPKRKDILMSKDEIEIVLVDATETPIERPKRIKKNRKNLQKHYYSGKKKKHTLKAQVVVNKKNSQVLAVNFSNGKKHDFKLFKESKIRIKKQPSY